MPVRRQSKKAQSLRNLTRQKYHLCTELPTATVEKARRVEMAMWRRYGTTDPRIIPYAADA